MLDISVRIDGDRVLIQGLDRIAGQLPKVIDRALERVAKGVHADAYLFLSGAGSKKSTRRGAYAGGYPVPVRTGHLRRMLDWLKPGETKSGDAGTFTAGEHEVIVYDSAEYADVIHEGKGSSAKFGRRPYLQNALQKFNQGGKVKAVIEEEIQKAVEAKG